jgi:hypothetical protein
MKIWTALLDISHIIGQLLEKGSLIQKEMFGSNKNIAKRLYEHLRYLMFKKPEQWPRRQIRLFHNPNTIFAQYIFNIRNKAVRIYNIIKYSN